MPERPANVRNQDFFEVATGFTCEMAIAEAERCLQCKKPLCVQGCPVGIDIPAFLDYIAIGDFAGSIKRLKEDTNLPAICGRVCPQETQCEEKCIVGKKHKSVGIGALERFVADWERENGDVQPPQPAAATGKKVAVVGSGPAGLTAAGELARRGHAVTVFEALHEPGGVLVYGIPEFRLPKEIVRREVDGLRKLGVEIRLNAIVGRSLTIDDMFDDGYDAVFVGTGAGLPHFLGIPGENLNGVYSANEFLTRMNLMKAFRFPDYHTPVHVGSRIAVFGGGNTAMDAARTAFRMGPESVKLIYRRSENEMPARIEEIHHGRDEGVEFVTLTAPIEFLDDGKGWLAGVKIIKMELGEPDASGRRRPVPIEGSEEIIPIDTAVIAIGNSPNQLVPQTTRGLETARHGTIVANELTGETSKTGVFAGGDVVTGAATVIQAMGAGKASAAAIDDFLMNRAAHEELQKYRDRLSGFFLAGAPERKYEERLDLLRSLGVPDAEGFLAKRLPQWDARVDELLDPESLDVMPVHVSHAHARYVRGTVEALPESVKAKILSAKLVPTGLLDIVKSLFIAVRGVPLSDGFTVLSVTLLNDVRQSTRVAIQDGGRGFTFDVVRLNAEGEVVFASVAEAVGIPHCRAELLTTPRGEIAAVVVVPDGANLVDESAFSDEYFRAHWPELVEKIAEQEALADFLGVEARSGTHVVMADTCDVVAGTHIEMFHYAPEASGFEEPALQYVMNGALPDNPETRTNVAAEIIKRYETGYCRAWSRIQENWEGVDAALTLRSAQIELCAGMPLAKVAAQLRGVLRWNPVSHLTRLYEVHIPEIWAQVKPAVWQWRRESHT
jgi:glutamate synthase (NADPH/NADH) small chain